MSLSSDIHDALKTASGPLTNTEIRDRIDDRGYDAKTLSARVSTALLKLIERGAIERIDADGHFQYVAVPGWAPKRGASDDEPTPRGQAEPTAPKAARGRKPANARKPAAKKAPRKNVKRQRRVVAADPPAAAAESIADLRAAAVDILIRFGSDPLPRSLHRLVVSAAGVPL